MASSETPAGFSPDKSARKKVKTWHESEKSAREEDTADVSMEDGNEWEVRAEDDDSDDGEENEDAINEKREAEHDDVSRKVRAQRDTAQVLESFQFAHPTVGATGHGNTQEENPPTPTDGWTYGDKVNTIRTSTARQFVCVDYPGIIHNPDKALATLGGLEGIGKAVSDNWKLELAFRPTDPFCKPVVSTVTNSRHFLLRVRRRRAVSAAEDGVSPDTGADGLEYQIEMVGLVVKVYTFEKLCDFQYLPVSKGANGQYTEILSSIRPTFSDDRQAYLSRQIPIFLPPFSFTRREWPVKYNFEPESLSKGETMEETVIGFERKARNFGAYHIHYDHPGVPRSALPEVLANISKLLPELREKTLSAITKLYDQRPVWSRSGLSAHLDSTQRRYLKMILPACAYFMVNGPWRGMWCKFGYDPRTEPTAKLYQTVDYRIRSVMNRQKVESKRGLDICRFAQGSTQKPVASTAVIPTVQAMVTDQADLTSNELVYKFWPDQLPPYRQMNYQACDVHHPEIQRLLHENDGKETNCTERDGWCVPDFTAICRDILSATVEKLFAK